MDTLILAQTLFYFISSIAILVVGILLAVFVYHLVRIVKNIDMLSTRVTQLSEDIRAKVSSLFEKVSSLSFIPGLFGQKRKTRKKKD